MVFCECAYIFALRGLIFVKVVRYLHFVVMSQIVALVKFKGFAVIEYELFKVASHSPHIGLALLFVYGKLTIVGIDAAYSKDNQSKKHEDNGKFKNDAVCLFSHNNLLTISGIYPIGDSGKSVIREGFGMGNDVVL